MTTYFKSASVAGDVLARYRMVLSRWPVANTQFTVSTCAGLQCLLATDGAWQ